MFKNLFFAFFAFIGVFFASCSDDGVAPPQSEFDPPRYEWRTMDIYYHGFAGMWAKDTSRIFLLNHYNRQLYIVSGGSTEIHYVGDYYLNDIKGISASEVYIFGVGLYNSMLTIIKWNGAGFEYYPSDITVTGVNYSMVRGGAVNSGEVWACSRNGIAKFNGINVTDYSYEDINLLPVDIFLNVENKIQYIAERFIDTTQIQQTLFEFQDTGFVKIFDYVDKTYIDRSYTYLREIDGNAFGLNFNEPLNDRGFICIKYFTGSSFMDYFCFNKKIASTWSVQSLNPVGVNLQNFMFLVSSMSGDPLFDPYSIGIIHWNGIRASKETHVKYFSSPYPYMDFILGCINTDSYLVLGQYSEIVENSTLYIATKKKGII